MLNTYSQKHTFYMNTMTRVDSDNGLKGSLRFNEPMSKHTSWRVGGPADRFYMPYDLEDLKAFLGQLPRDEPITWIGLGSNVLVRDGGIRGTVIVIKNSMDTLRLLDTDLVMAGAGVPCAKLARFSVRHELTGAEFLVGIPGTLGGALAMNAGAFGSETWDVVQQVSVLNRYGEEVVRNRSDFVIGYRSVRLPTDEWFVSAIIKLRADTDQTGIEIMRELLERRSETQPVGEKSCGSVFRNPEQSHAAAKLIETCGLKGARSGKAVVSEKHTNFIINTGGATAGDIENLIRHIQDVVYKTCNVRLDPEVRILGNTG